MIDECIKNRLIDSKKLRILNLYIFLNTLLQYDKSKVMKCRKMICVMNDDTSQKLLVFPTFLIQINNYFSLLIFISQSDIFSFT